MMRPHIKPRRPSPEIVPCLLMVALTGSVLSRSLDAETPTPTRPLEIKKLYLAPIQQVSVPSRQEGQLETIHVELGQRVQAGGLLAALEDEDARNSVRLAELNLDLARKMSANRASLALEEKALDVAQRELERAEQLRERVPDGVSRAELDELQLDVTRAGEALHTAQHEKELAAGNEQIREVELQTAQLLLKRRLVVAPFDGVVTKVFRNPGEWVKPGDEVVRLVRMDRLRVDAYVDVRYLDWNLDHSAVEMRVTLPDRPKRTYRGKVVFVNPEVDPFNNQVQIRIEFDNADRSLQPGFQVDIFIAAPQRTVSVNQD